MTKHEQKQVTSHNQANDRPAKVLVTGGHGKTGRRVAERLRQVEGITVKQASRRAPQSPNDVRFDWDDSGTWQAALLGVDAVYTCYAPDLAVPQAPAAIERFVGLAKAHGVERLVLLSGRGEPEAQRCEQIVLQSGIASTVVRASWFMQNFTEGAFVESLKTGVLALPAGDVPEPFVDVDDVADVAVAALVESGHAGKVYEVTGPEALTFAEAVAVMSEAAGHPMRFVEIDTPAFVDGLQDHGVPKPVAELLVHLFDEVLDGRNVATVDGVQQALGRPARSLAAFAKQAAATGVWEPAISGKAVQA